MIHWARIVTTIVLCILFASLAHAQSSVSGPDPISLSWGELAVRSISALFFCLAGVGIVTFILKKTVKSNAAPEKAMQLLSSMQLPNHSVLHLVKVEGQKFLCLVSGNACHMTPFLPQKREADFAPSLDAELYPNLSMSSTEMSSEVKEAI